MLTDNRLDRRDWRYYMTFDIPSIRCPRCGSRLNATLSNYKGSVWRVPVYSHADGIERDCVLTVEELNNVFDGYEDRAFIYGRIIEHIGHE